MLIGDRASNGKTYYYLLDAQESVVGVMDSSGNLVDSYVYDPFGNLFKQNETVANPWQYASGYMDSTTGLYHFGARYYNPTLGRWTQEDPAGPNLASPDSLNPYLYVDDSPVNGTDPSGKSLIECIGGAFIGLLTFDQLGGFTLSILLGLALALLAGGPFALFLAGLVLGFAFFAIVGEFEFIWNTIIAPACGLPSVSF